MTYFIEEEQVAKLRKISDALHAGNDKERNLGHKLWLVVGDVEQQTLGGTGGLDNRTNAPVAQG